MGVKTKIGRNELCPCGSGKKYKNCCLRNEGVSKVDWQFKQLHENSRIKQCLYPDHKHCSKEIVRAHSIQNNKILSRLSEEGCVTMFCSKPSSPFEIPAKYGRREASTFTGFCSYHDKILFQPIEDNDFLKTPQQIFLYVYRCLALEYHKKQEAVKLFRLFQDKNNKYSVEQDEFFKGFTLSLNDYQEEKHILDEALLNNNFDVLTSFVWEISHSVNFAFTGAEVITRDFDGKLLQNLASLNACAHIFYILFSEKGKTYVIIAWLKKNDTLFHTIKEKFEKTNNLEIQNYINNIMPMCSENIVIKPSAWEAMDDNQKKEYELITLGIEDLSDWMGYQFDRFEKTNYDMFLI